ncbi:MAG: alpha/beta hydrolase [Erysipelotrichaceae bacterium]|nr:alpha/beta hydrolase [Erysipelotrichaceae bacterium]
MKIKNVVRGIVLATAVIATTTVVLVRRFVKDILYRNIVTKKEFPDDRAQLVRIEDESKNVLNGYLIEKAGANTTLIMLHGLKSDATLLADYVPYFEKMMPTANILLVDALGHGMSDGLVRGLGINDAHSLIIWNKYVLNRFGEDQRIVIYGKGVGAVTALIASEQLTNVDIIVSDGAYRNLIAYLTDLCFKKYGVPPRISEPLIRIQIKAETGMDIIDGNTVNAVARNTIPTIFIHSKADDDVPFKHVFKIYNKNAGECALFPIKEEHLYDMNPEEAYSKTLDTFLRNYQYRG